MTNLLEYMRTATDGTIAFIHMAGDNIAVEKKLSKAPEPYECPWRVVFRGSDINVPASMLAREDILETIDGPFVTETLDHFDRATFHASHLIDICHGLAHAGGWWHDTKTGESLINENEFWKKILLTITEFSEATEGLRKRKMDDHLPDRRMLAVEIADGIIRSFDLAGALMAWADMQDTMSDAVGIKSSERFKNDVAASLGEKLRYNSTREDHKIENRRKPGGKSS